MDGLALPRRIGVCINYGAHIWYQIQSANERELAAQLGIALEAVDANMNAERQTEQIKQFLDQGIDALIYSAAEPAKAPSMLEAVHAAGIPVITESLWVNSPAVKANVMINDYKGGQKVGRSAAKWIKESMTGPVKVLDVAAPWLEEGLQRSDGFLAGLRESLSGSWKVYGSTVAQISKHRPGSQRRYFERTRPSISSLVSMTNPRSGDVWPISVSICRWRTC